MPCNNKNSIQGSILVTISQAPHSTEKDHESRKSEKNFHWTSPDQALLRRFLVKSVSEFGPKKAGKVLNALVKKWLDGRVKVRI